MPDQSSNDSLKVYCNSTLKKQVKNLAAINGMSTSNYIVNLIEKHINGLQTPTTLSYDPIQKDLHQLEILAVSLFKGIFEAIGKEDTFEEICSQVYRKDLNSNENN